MSLAPSLAAVEKAESESAELEFKASFDPAAASHWCELLKDIVAIANSGGGAIVFGVSDDGTPAAGELSAVLGIDPA
jgi:predicted HTH transcriptional regulator